MSEIPFKIQICPNYQIAYSQQEVRVLTLQKRGEDALKHSRDLRFCQRYNNENDENGGMIEETELTKAIKYLAKLLAQILSLESKAHTPQPWLVRVHTQPLGKVAVVHSSREYRDVLKTCGLALQDLLEGTSDAMKSVRVGAAARRRAWGRPPAG
ncbi:hypothetical protein ON010_g2300 [Phytophthora cinnamomi]|nr:hypothetical protein ON010_g2300 [Phytophthora cinnamomi]